MNHVVDKNLNPPDYTREEVFDWINQHTTKCVMYKV
jgi:hypothetical protein